MLRLRNLVQSDVEFVTQLCMFEGWDKIPQDIERYIECEPNGCFIAEVDDRVAGHVFSISYGHMGWIGLLIVHPHYRRKDLGTELMKKAIEYLHHLGTNIIQLEALPNSVDFHKKLGFREEFESLRFKTTINKVPCMSSSKGVEIKKIGETDLASIAKLDFHYFGVNRRKVLQKFYRDFPDLSFVAMDNKSIGYVMCRKSNTGYKIGPWVCDPEKPKIAKDLLLACMQRLESNKSLIVGVPSVNRQAVQIVQRLDFAPMESRLRMRLGPSDIIGNVAGIFAIGDPGKG